MSGTRGFKVIDETAVATPPEVKPTGVDIFNARSILIGLHVLSQKAVVAVSALFTAALVGSAWLLWWSVLPSPTTPQLIGLGGYAAFVLLVEIVRRRSA